MLTARLRRLGLRPGDRLLDLGCGGGRHAVAGAREGGRVVAMDRDPASLAATRRGVGAVGPGGVSVVRGDALHLPFDDGAFDRIVAAEVLAHLPDDAAAAAELARVLRPGGPWR